MTRQKALNEIKELKENVSHWRTEVGIVFFFFCVLIV